MVDRPGLSPAAALAAAAAAHEPVLIVAGSQVPVAAARVGVLAGTFDPPTRAHLGLVDAALADGCGVVVACIALRSVDKEDRGGAAQRLARVAQLMAAHPSGRAYAAATNAGLYVDLADAAHAAFGNDTEIDLVCGADKVRQIFDPRYYPDGAIDDVLARLFARARLLAAPRAGEGPLPVHPRVAPLAIADEFFDVSSSEVRRILAAGGDAAHLLPDT